MSSEEATARARGEYRPLTKVSSSKRTALPGSRPHLLQMVQTCGQHQRAPLRALLVRIDGMGPWGGAMSRAHQKAQSLASHWIIIVGSEYVRY